MSITSFQLTSSVGGSNLPFTIGLGFKKGDIPNEPVLNIAGYQVKVPTRWGDGSAKMAVVSGEMALAANTPTTINVSNGTAPTGTNLTAADIATANPSASVQCGAIGTVNLSSLLASPFRTRISGSQMVECHYRAAVGSDASLVIWFHVRLYKSGRIWVRAIVENGYVDTGTTVDKSYIPTVTIGGAQVYNNGGASLSHYAYTRWEQNAWIGGDPQITPKHDVAYLIRTKLVPNYWKRTPSSAALDALLQTYSPMSNVGLTVSMGGTGFQNQIGLLPLWDALYATSGDARAFRSCIANSSALNSYPICWRDATTHVVPKPTDHPTSTLATYDFSAGPLTWEMNHAPSEGYLAYLITGDYWHYETMMLHAALCYLARSNSSGNGVNRILYAQTRGTAWNLRTLTQACALAEDTDAVAADYKTLLANNITYWKAIVDGLVAAGSNLGYIYEYNINAYAAGVVAPWQDHFLIQSLGYGSDLEPIASMSNFVAVRNHMYKAIVGILGAPSGFNFTDASAYNLKVTDGTSGDPLTWYYDWHSVYTASVSAGLITADAGNTLLGTSGGDPSQAPIGYWGNLLPAISYAIDHGAPGAQAAWQRLTGATNWSVVAGSGFDDNPIWGLTRRQSTMPVDKSYNDGGTGRIYVGRHYVAPPSGLPSWVAALPLWQWYGIPNTALSSVAPSPTPPGSTGPQSKINTWGGLALKRTGSIAMLGACGGHADYAGNEVDALALNTETPAWMQLCAPSPTSQIIDASQFYLDYKPAATHTYWGLQFLNSRNKMVLIRSPGIAMGMPAAPAGWPYATFPGYSASFNLDTNDWDSPETIQRFVGNGLATDTSGVTTSSGDWTAAFCAKHPLTDDIYYAPVNDGFYKLSASTLTWTKINNNYDTNYCATAVDPTRNRIMVMGNFGGTEYPKFRGFDGSYDYSQIFGGLGRDVLTVGGYPGLIYDEVNDIFLAFLNDAINNVIQTYRITAGTLIVDQPPITGPLPTKRPNGICGSVQYVPELGGVVLANSYTGNVQFMRTSLTGV